MPDYSVDPNVKKVEAPLCELSCLFEAISRSKSLQVVHYSGNSLQLRSINKIHEILKVIPGHGYGSESKSKKNQQDLMFGNLDTRMDVDVINKMV